MKDSNSSYLTILTDLGVTSDPSLIQRAKKAIAQLAKKLPQVTKGRGAQPPASEPAQAPASPSSYKTPTPKPR